MHFSVVLLFSATISTRYLLCRSGQLPTCLPLRLSTPANTLSCVVERSLFPSGGSLLTVRGLDFAFTRDCLLLNSELNLTRTKSVSRGICRQVSTPSCGGHCGTQAWLGVGISTGAPTDYQYRRYRALICCFQRSPTLAEIHPTKYLIPYPRLSRFSAMSPVAFTTAGD